MPEDVVKASQNFLRDAHVLQKLFSYEKYWSGMIAVNPLFAFYDI
jgi:hypothetical protein